MVYRLDNFTLLVVYEKGEGDLEKFFQFVVGRRHLCGCVCGITKQQRNSLDVEMVEEEIKPAPKKKKVKKVIPVGRNGLKKRRVVKSRMTTDAKGYMGSSSCFMLTANTELSPVFEEYSSYESVDEEQEETKPKKSDSKSSSKVKQEEEPDSAASTPQPEKPAIKAAGTKAKPTLKASNTKGQPKQKSLKNFFVAPKKT